MVFLFDRNRYPENPLLNHHSTYYYDYDYHYHGNKNMGELPHFRRTEMFGQ